MAVRDTCVSIRALPIWPIPSASGIGPTLEVAHSSDFCSLCDGRHESRSCSVRTRTAGGVAKVIFCVCTLTTTLSGDDMDSTSSYHHPQIEPYSRGEWMEVAYSWMGGIIATLLVLLAL